MRLRNVCADFHTFNIRRRASQCTLNVFSPSYRSLHFFCVFYVWHLFNILASVCCWIYGQFIHTWPHQFFTCFYISVNKCMKNSLVSSLLLLFSILIWAVMRAHTDLLWARLHFLYFMNVFLSEVYWNFV